MLRKLFFVIFQMFPLRSVGLKISKNSTCLNGNINIFSNFLLSILVNSYQHQHQRRANHSIILSRWSFSQSTISWTVTGRRSMQCRVAFGRVRLMYVRLVTCKPAPVTWPPTKYIKPRAVLSRKLNQSNSFVAAEINQLLQNRSTQVTFSHRRIKEIIIKKYFWNTN